MLKYAFQHYFTCTDFFSGYHSAVLPQVIYNRLHILNKGVRTNEQSVTFQFASILVLKIEINRSCPYDLKYLIIEKRLAHYKTFCFVS